MINIEGYKVFHGGLTVKPINGMEPFTMTGDWLYKPDCDCWYGRGKSFPADICETVELDRVAELEADVVRLEQVRKVQGERLAVERGEKYIMIDRLSALQSHHKEAMKLLSVLVPFGEAYCVAWNPKGADRYEALKAQENGGATPRADPIEAGTRRGENIS